MARRKIFSTSIGALIPSRPLVIVTIGLTLGLGAVGLWLNAPAVQLLVAIGVVWLPALTWIFRARARQAGLTRAGFELFLLIQLLHLGEHLIQMTQLFVLGWPPSASRGLISQLDVEKVHFIWNFIVLVALVWLLRRGLRSAWLTATLVWASLHTAEHSYLLLHALRTGLESQPGILGAKGLLAAFGWQLGGLTSWSRPTVHFGWNVGEVTLLTLAFLNSMLPHWIPRQLFRVTGQSSADQAWRTNRVRRICSLIFLVGLVIGLFQTSAQEIGPPEAQTLFSDDFNRPDAASVGSQWTVDSGVWAISGNQLLLNSSTGDAIVHTASPLPQADYQVQSRITPLTGPGNGALIARFIDENNAYVLGVWVGGNSVNLWSVVGGQWSELGSYSPAGGLVLGANYHLRLTAQGSQVTGEFSADGGTTWVTVASVSDGNLSQPGVAGYWGWDSTLRGDDFIVTAAQPFGLVAAYTFDEGAGTTVADASGTGNTGTISGATWTSQGKFGGALSFDGVNDWVTVNDAPTLDLTTGMTLEAWVYPTAGSGWRTVVLKEQPGQLAYALYAWSDDPQPSGFVFTSADLGILGPTALPLNTWSHLATTYDGSTLRLFVNGSLVSSRTVSGNIITSSMPLRIGGNSVWGEYFQGRIDEVRIYNRALSLAEIQSDMNTPVATPTNPAPVLSSLSPSSATAGGPAFTLTVTGSNFISSSVVRWNGADRTTTFGSATQLQATIPASDIASAGTAQMTVFNPAPGGGTSNALSFTVSASLPDFQITNLSNPPATAMAGTSFNVTDTTANSGIASAGTSTTTYRLSLDATVTGSDPQIGSRAIPTLGGGASSIGTVIVTIPPNLTPGTYYLGACADDTAIITESSETNNCRISTTSVAIAGQPVISNLSLTSGTVGTSVTITGSNFGTIQGTSTITFNGIAATPTSWSATIIVAPAPVGATTGPVVVTVDGLASNGLTFTVIPPAGTGLVAAYSFDEGAGTTVADSSGSGNSGTISGATWSAQGKFGSALSFDGINDWVTVNDAPSLDLTTAMTLEAWAYPTVGSGWRTVVLKEQPGQLAYALYAWSDNPQPSGYVFTSADLGTFGPTALPLNTWSHLATTYDGSALRLYVNGALVSSRAVSGTIVTSAMPLRIGGNSVWGEYFQGLIDEVRIYDRALSLAEIQNDMNTRVANPVPVLNSLSPSSAVAGSPAFTLTVNGSNFIQSSVVRWNGSNRTTTYVSAAQLQAAIPASDIATAGTAQVTVFNPTPGGGSSNALTFTITAPNPVPTASTLSPSSAVAGSPAFTLTVTGGNFIQSSVVRWNGTDRTTTYVSVGQLQAAIPASDIAVAGTAQVTVFNPTPGGGSSNALTFTISAAVPDLQITSLANPPATAIVGTSFSVTETTANIDTGSAGTSTTSYWLSLDATITSGDQQIGSREVPALGAGASSSGTVTVNIPVTLAPGTYFLGACADHAAVIAESSETNNCRASTTTVTVSVQPVIDSLSPVSGPVGASVTITGVNFEPSATQVSFNGTAAIIRTVTATTITTTVPIGATTGPLTVTTSRGSASLTFIVTTSQDFTIQVAPADAQTLQGSSATYTIELLSTGATPFTGLATLSVEGLPSGVNATLGSPTLTGGQRGTLTLSASATAPLGLTTFTVRATAPTETGSLTRTVAPTLTVLASGRTALLGQITFVNGAPIEGVQLGLGSLTATTDPGGNFLFLDPPIGTQMLGIDANLAQAGLPIYAIEVVLTAGQTTQLPPLRITPPPPPERFVPIANSTQDQTITDPRFPGASITLPAGVTITGWDGTLKTQVSLERLSPDALPVPPPPGVARSFYQVFFGTPMGGLPSAPLPVTLPNDQELAPGEEVEIWYYDAAPIAGATAGWRLAGLGTVIEDGTKVVSNPGVGIQRFCGVCGVFCILKNALGQSNQNPQGPKGGEPVDLATGQMIVEKTDLVLPGRLPAVIRRSFNALDPYGRVAGFELPTGPGWTLSVDMVLLEESASLRRLILPGNARFPFARQADGTFINSTYPDFAGAVLTQLGSSHTLRFRDGTTWRFASGWLGRGFPIAGLGLLVEQTDRNGNRLTITRDVAGGATRITEPSGRALALTISLLNPTDQTSARLIEVTGFAGSVRYGYHPISRRLETVTDPAGGVTTYTYDSSGRILTVTDPRNITFLTNEYDAQGRVIRQTQADSGIWTFAYEGPAGAHTQVTVTDPRGQTTVHRMNNAGFSSETINALGQATRLERDAAGQVISSTDALGRVTRFEYDAAGNLTRLTNPTGAVRTLTYDPLLNKVTIATDALGNISRFEYDAQGNLIATTDPLGNRSTIAYDNFGQPTAVTNARGETETAEYDTYGNIVTMTDALGNRTTNMYDDASRLISQTDSLGQVTQFTYDALDRPVTIVEPTGAVTSFAYDASSNVVSVTDGRGNTTTHVYNGMNQLVTRTDAAGRTESYGYDFLGNIVQFTDRKGQVSQFSYDALNRRVRSVFADGSTVELTYDALTQLILARDSVSGPILNEYDTIGRLVRQHTSQGSLTLSYDAQGRRTQMVVNGLAPVDYTFDPASRLQTITRSGIGTASLQYDAAHWRTGLTLPNGTTTTYTYDAASRLSSLSVSGASTPSELNYEYNSVGLRTGVRGTGARTLVPGGVSSATYDPTNRLLNSDAASYTYDANGNVTSITEGTVVRTFTWDARNRLVAAVGPGGTATYKYDAFGRRIEKVVNGTTKRYLYDADDIIAELDELNAIKTHYLRGAGVDEPLARLDTASGETLFYHADANNSITHLTSSNGSVIEAYTYDAFGNIASTGGVPSQPFTYTGREYDAETGLYFYRARMYDPKAGRFLQEDPLGFAASETNLYVYVLNNPVNLLDPYGLECSTLQRKAWEAVGPPRTRKTERIVDVLPPADIIEWLADIFGPAHGQKGKRKLPIPCGIKKVFVYEITEQLYRYQQYYRVVCYDCRGQQKSDTGWMPFGYEEEKYVTVSEREKGWNFRLRCGN